MVESKQGELFKRQMMIFKIWSYPVVFANSSSQTPEKPLPLLEFLIPKE
jgi:hypothetical protein